MRFRRAAVVTLGALVLTTGAAAAAAGPNALAGARLTEAQATRAFLAKGKAADWVGRYPKRSRVTQARYARLTRDWTVHVWSGSAGEIARGRVDDLTGLVTEAWTGPQVAWTMARGFDEAFGGKTINTVPVWLALCAVFLLGLADLRRPLSLRNLDLLVLLSFSVSLWYFNDGRIFTSVPLAYPPLVYLLGRMIWIGARGRGPLSAPVWPVWLLVAASIFLAGFRIGLDVSDSKVADVGYSGVIGAHRIMSGQAPYGHFPQEVGKACAAADRDGRTQYRIQPNGRCEASDARGDTYGPVGYETYLPGYWAMGWTGIGDQLNAARFTSIMFDVLCVIGLFLVGRSYGGMRLAVTLVFAWEAFPFNQYVLGSNTNDAIQPAFLIFGFWLASSAWARGGSVALAGWTKFAPLLLAPLWATYPDVTRVRARSLVAFGAAFLAVTVVVFSIILLEPSPTQALSVFWHRTIGNQLGRESPFSIWDWRQYHAGLPDLHILQRVLQVALVVGAVAVAFVPRRKSPLQLAALTAAILIGFELVLTHWFYLYLPWFFPFVAFAVLAPAPARVPEEVAERSDRQTRELVPAG